MNEIISFFVKTRAQIYELQLLRPFIRCIDMILNKFLNIFC